MLLSTWLMELDRYSESVRLLQPLTRILPDNEEVWFFYDQAKQGLEGQLGRPVPERYE